MQTWKQQRRVMSTFIVSIAAERFGVKEPHATKTTTGPNPNRREQKITQLRQELRKLRSQYRKASEVDKAALAELRSVVRGRLTTLRCAEWHWRRGREKARKCSAFILNAFVFTKKLLGQKRSGHLSCPEEEVNLFLSNTYRDRMRERDLGHCDTLISPPQPSSSFNIKEPTLKEVIKSARASSAPGPSGVPIQSLQTVPKASGASF